jgi:hypothetical protein
MSEPEVASPAPPAAPSRGGWTFLLVFAAVTAAFAGFLVAHNTGLFAQPIYEDGDAAVNSLLVFKAKRLELLHGHCSRLNFYHPGPGLLYALAGAEWAFHDCLKIVPAPHNAHILGHLLFCATLIGLSLTIIARGVNNKLAATAAGLVFLVYFAREGHLSCHWFAYVFFMVYLAFQVSAASVASGRVAHLGYLAGTGSLAVHSHVCFVAFVVPISAYAVFRAWASGGYRLRTLPSADRRAWIVFAGVIGLFVLPIVMHAALHYPGEIGRYLQYAKHPAGGGGSARAVSTFLVRSLTHESALGWPLALGVLAGAGVAVLSFRGPQRSFPRQLGVVALLSSAAMIYYAARGVDDLQQTYIGIFFGSVLLLAWTLIGMRLGVVLDRGPVWRGVALVVGAGVAAWAGYTGVFTNTYAGAPEAPAVADAICSDPRWEGGPPALTLNHDCWPQTAAVLVQLERRGARPWVVDGAWDVILTDQFRLVGRPITTLWQIDVARSTESEKGVNRVLGEFAGASFRAVETRVPLGRPIPLGQWERPPGAKPVLGWQGTGALDYLMPISNEATLLVDAPAPVRDVRLTIRAQAIAPGSGEQRVGVVVNGQSVGEVTFAGRDEDRALVFASEVLKRHSPAQIAFVFPDARGYKTRRTPGVVEKYSIQLNGLMLTPLGP